MIHDGPLSAAAVTGVLVPFVRLILGRAGTLGLRTLRAVVMVRPVPAVHEHVHQGTGEEQQPGQYRNHVRSMLAQEEVSGDGDEDAQAPAQAPLMDCRIRARLRNLMRIHAPSQCIGDATGSRAGTST
jgi:hypothetical protein